MAASIRNEAAERGDFTTVDEAAAEVALATALPEQRDRVIASSFRKLDPFEANVDHLHQN